MVCGTDVGIRGGSRRHSMAFVPDYLNDCWPCSCRNSFQSTEILNRRKRKHMIDFGLGKLWIWSVAAACAGLFMTQAHAQAQAAGPHPAAFTLSDVMEAPYPH